VSGPKLWFSEKVSKEKMVNQTCLCTSLPITMTMMLVFIYTWCFGRFYYKSSLPCWKIFIKEVAAVVTRIWGSGPCMKHFCGRMSGVVSSTQLHTRHAFKTITAPPLKSTWLERFLSSCPRCLLTLKKPKYA